MTSAHLRSPSSRRELIWRRFLARVHPPIPKNLNRPQRVLCRLDWLVFGGRKRRQAERARREALGRLTGA
jgi:hypothetical protein